MLDQFLMGNVLFVFCKLATELLPEKSLNSSINDVAVSQEQEVKVSDHLLILLTPLLALILSCRHHLHIPLLKQMILPHQGYFPLNREQVLHHEALSLDQLLNLFSL